jgi:cytoskeleton protein RodZ
MNDDDRPQEPLGQEPPPREPEPVGPGRMVREARERKQLSIQAVADALNLRVSMVEALEAERFDQLPPATFTKGYLKNYAKLVDVPEDEVVLAYDRLRDPVPVSEDEVHGFRRPASRTAKSSGGLVWVLLLVAAVLVALWLGRDWIGAQFEGEPAAEETAPPPAPIAEAPPRPVPGQEVQPSPQAPPEPLPAPPQEIEEEPVEEAEPLPEPVRPAEPLPAPVGPAPEPEAVIAGDARLVVRVLAESWVDIRDGDGRSLLLGVIDGPRTHEFTAPPPYSLVIGNANAVELEYEGDRVNLRPFMRGRVARLTLGADS